MKKHRSLHCSSGFTLIELSIVLVIIGLIAGGVLVGRDMIEAAKLRKIPETIEQYNMAVHTFKVKYNCLPGDCTNATQFFGVHPDGCGGAVRAAETWQAGVCDYNGTGNIGDLSHETNGLWSHLDNAELIEGDYYCNWTGNGSYGQNPKCSPNLPSLKVGDAMVRPFHGSSVQLSGSGGNIRLAPYKPKDKHYYVQGKLLNASPQKRIYTPNEARMVDIKFDDGLPHTGRVTTEYNTSHSWCATGAINAYAVSDEIQYEWTSPLWGCILLFDAQF